MQIPRPEPSSLLELRDVTKVYGNDDVQVHALAGVTLAIEEGEFVAVVGASGSGKSTCMNVLGCLDRPTSGSYLFRGVDVTHLELDQLALLRRHNMGFVFQGFNLLSRTTALENVELPLVYRRVPAAQRREQAKISLRVVGLEGREHHTPGQLSGGQQQRVAIARAIVTNPSILLADEPTGNLDSTRKDDIMRLLADLNAERGITVVMVTHEPNIARWARRIVEFADGIVSRDSVNSGRGG